MTRFFEHLFTLPTWLAVGFVFLLPAAEASVFLGFVFPGELAVILGGVLAFQGRTVLWVVLLAAIAGAITGDSIGYFVGRRWGQSVLDSTLGRFVKDHHLERGKSYLADRGGVAVVVGRWTAALRALIPGLAGMSGMEYRRFLLWNAIGGTLWATTFVLIGDLAGNSWRHLERQAHTASLAVAALLVTIISIGLIKYLRRRRAAETVGSTVLVHPLEDRGPQP